MSKQEYLMEDIGSISGRPRNRKPFREEPAINRYAEENMRLKDKIDKQEKELIRLRAEVEKLRLEKSQNRGSVL